MPELTADTLSILSWLIGGFVGAFMVFPVALFGVLIAGHIRDSVGGGRLQ